MAMVQITHPKFGKLPINVTPASVRAMPDDELAKRIAANKKFVLAMGIAKDKMQYNYLDMLQAEQDRRKS